MTSTPTLAPSRTASTRWWFLLVLANSGCSTSSAGTEPVPDASVDTAPVMDARAADQSTADASSDASVDAESAEAAVSDGAAVTDTGSADAADDASPICDGVLCAGACLAAPDCRGCSGAPLLCGPRKTCVADCARCVDESDASVPIACFACDSAGQNPLGTCQPLDASAYCLGGDYFGSYVDGGPGFHCGCNDGGVGGCPGSTQVCASAGASLQCFTCGELTFAATDGVACGGGGRCASAKATCQ